MKGTLQDWLKLARIEHAFMVMIAILISESLAAKYAGLGFSLSFSTIFPAIGPFFITAAAFILNDYFGFRTDKLNKRLDRPLVAKSIRRQDALKVSVFLFALGLLLTLYVNIYCFIIALIFSFLSAVYDNYLKKQPFLGNAFIASSMSISFLYGNYAIIPELQEIVLLFVSISFLAGMGRELLITLRDIKGDKQIGATTLPMLLGAKNTIFLSGFFFLSAILLSWVPLNGEYLSIYALFIYINNLLLLYCIYLSFRKRSVENFRKIRNFSLYALIIGLLAFASLAF